MEFAGDIRKRSDDVVQSEYRWSPDLDVLMSYHGESALPELPTTETVTEEQASGSTDLPMRIVVGKRPTQQVAEKRRDPRQTCESW